MLMEMLGVQLAGASFVQPDTQLRTALTDAAVDKLLACTAQTDQNLPLYRVVTEYSLVNAIVGLLATGGSTNHCLHLVAIARSAGIEITWEDMDQLSAVVPLLAKVYPNGNADINHFQEAGGMAFLVHELRSAAYLNENVQSIMGQGLDHYEIKPSLSSNNEAVWSERIDSSLDLEVLTSATKPFSNNGGLRLLSGNIGKAVIKVSAVAEQHQIVEAPARVFHSQNELKVAFEAEELFTDVIAVVRFQGPAANGMPELHKMTPYLGVAQDRGFKVALVTDGRMSGASGKVPAAIHVSPEALAGGLINKIENGDIIRLDANAGTLELLVEAETLSLRKAATPPPVETTLGRPLFNSMRNTVNVSTLGASTIHSS